MQNQYQFSVEFEQDFSEILNNPKNELQFALYKTSLAFEQLSMWIVEELTPIINNAIKDVYKLYCSYAKQYYPRIVHLALYSKKARIRKKNKARLLRLMLKIVKE